MQRTTEIEFEFDETIAYSRPDERFKSFCPECKLWVEMAAPHVAGTAALLVSILGRRPDAIKERLEESADQVGGPDLRAFYGHGRLNVARAVGALHKHFADR